jgi:hypothetical protein
MKYAIRYVWWKYKRVLKRKNRDAEAQRVLTPLRKREEVSHMNDRRAGLRKDLGVEKEKSHNSLN